MFGIEMRRLRVWSTYKRRLNRAQYRAQLRTCGICVIPHHLLPSGVLVLAGTRRLRRTPLIVLAVVDGRGAQKIRRPIVLRSRAPCGRVTCLVPPRESGRCQTDSRDPIKLDTTKASASKLSSFCIGHPIGTELTPTIWNFSGHLLR